MRNYLVNCELLSERTGDYDKANKANVLFESISKEKASEELGSTCGNVEHDLAVDKETLKCTFKKRGFDDSLWLYETIPAALLMYRLACTFKGTIETQGQDGYKVPWAMYVKHKETGDIVEFREWKGAAGFGMKYHSADELPVKFKEDFLFLMDYLLSNECAHPYDGLTAGSVA